MMVVKVVGENLLSDQKARVVTAQLSKGFRQRQTEFRQAEHTRVFSRSLIHIDFGSFSVNFQRLPARFSTPAILPSLIPTLRTANDRFLRSVGLHTVTLWPGILALDKLA